MKIDGKKKLSKGAIAVFVSVLTLLALALIINLAAFGSASGQAARLEAEIRAMEIERAANEAELARRQTDEFVRDYARENLDMQNEGDRTFEGR